MRLLPLFISLTLAIVVGFVLFLKFNNGTPITATKELVVEKPVDIIRPEPTTQVMIASRYIAPGTVIDASMLDRQDWPKRLLVKEFIVADSPQANVIGMIARSPFQPREPLMLTKLAKQGDPSFIASTLPNGQRMVTIATDEINGVAGFVFPGDRVDVLLTHNVEIPNPSPQPNAQPKTEQITEPLIINAQVLAVDQHIQTDANEKQQLPKSVSLQVTPEDAQKLRLSEKRGALSLALRSLKDKDETITDPTTRFDITRFYEKQGEKDESGKNPIGKVPMAQSNINVVRGVAVEKVILEQR